MVFRHKFRDKIYGADMNIKEFGTQNSQTIIFLHGGGLSWWNYREEALSLSKHYHIVIPLLDGHAGCDADFKSISENADRIISFIYRNCNGNVLLIAGLSLGAQILTDILSKHENICQYAVIESACIIPSKITSFLLEPSVSSSFFLIKKKWFAKMQFRYLHLKNELFDDYYKDTCLISKENMIRFLKSSTEYKLSENIKNCRCQKIRIIAGSKEALKILKSARLLNKILPNSTLEIKDGLYHGEYSINKPELYSEELLDMLALFEADNKNRFELP